MVACALCGYGMSFLSIAPRQSIQSKMQLLKIALLASVLCFTVVMGNISLRFIPVSFNQVCLLCTVMSSKIWWPMMLYLAWMIATPNHREQETGHQEFPSISFSELQEQVRKIDNAQVGYVSQPWHLLQAIGATTPFFTAFMSYFMLRSRETAIVYVSLAPVVIGGHCHQLPLLDVNWTARAR